jgi:hypothetical protein
VIDVDGTDGSDTEIPWFVKIIIGVAILVVLFIIGVDIVAFSDALTVSGR